MKMPQTYKPRADVRRYSRYTLEQLQAAAQAVQNGTTYRAAAEEFGIPKDTIRREVKGEKKRKQYGRPNAISVETERAIVDSLLVAANWGYPLDCTELRFYVKMYLDRNKRVVSQFKKNLPGIDWCRTFLKRHPDISLRFCKKYQKISSRDYQENGNELLR